ncbi:hypothetical protein CFC21_040474, partial [Triticum aestivum]
GPSLEDDPRSRSTMSLKGYDEASLRPPAADDDAAASDSDWDWGEVLLDRAAYMADKENHTTADCQFTRDLDGKQINLRVTLCLAQPPRVSHFCCLAHCPADHGKEEEEEDTPRLFVGEPWMIATDGELALFTLCHGDDRCSRIRIGNHDYFVYYSAPSPSGKPRLTRLPQLSDGMLPTMGTLCFCASDIGIMRYCRSNNEDDADAYRIATLAYDYFCPDHSGYYLCTYDSEASFWSRRPAASPQPPPPDDYSCDMVIAIDGVMGWVDLWRGMLLCDVLADDTPCTPLCYLPLPKPRQPRNHLPLGTDMAYHFRDIVSVKDSGIIRFVDLQVHAEPGRRSQTPSGWTVVTWTLEGLDGGLGLDDLRFKEEYQLSSREISNYRLPQSLFVCKPILSSHEDGVLYLLTNASSQDVEGDCC